MFEFDDSLPLKLEALHDDMQQIKKILQENLQPQKRNSEINSKYLSLDQAIEFLGNKGFIFSKSRVYKMSSKKNGLPFKRFGSRLVFVMDELVEWCELQIKSPERNRKDSFLALTKQSNKNFKKEINNGK